MRAEEEKQHLLAKAKGVQNELCHRLEHLAERRKRRGGEVVRWDRARSTEEKEEKKTQRKERDGGMGIIKAWREVKRRGRRARL